MFTASHNPAEYNGVKLCRAGALPIGQDTGLAEIKAMVAGGLLERAEDPGRAESRDLLPAFVAHVHSFVDLDALAPLRVVADTANGVGGVIAPAVFAGLPFELTLLYGELDGTFPNHPADPTNTDNLKDLQRAVLDADAAVGLAFDGDADRVVLVDDQSQPVSGSTTTAMLAASILRPSPRRTGRAQPDLLEGRPRDRARARRHAHPHPGRSLVHQAGDGGDRRDLRRRALRALLLPRQLPRRLRHHRRPARARAAVDERCSRCRELRVPFERYAMSGEINTRVEDPLG